MFGVSFGEILLVLFIVTIIFGAPRLPQIGDSLGRSIRNFKRALRGENEIDVTPADRDQIDSADDKRRR